LSVLLFTIIVAVITGLVFGLIPAFSSEQNLVTALKESGGRASTGTKRQRVRNALIVAQVAISFMLLIGAGLMLKSFIKLQNVNPGYTPESVLVMRVSPNWSKYTQPEQYRTFFTRLIEDVKNQPGVASAALANSYPLNPAAISNGPQLRNFRIEDRPLQEGEPTPRIDFRVVTSDYFQTLRIPLGNGRLFTDADDANAPPVAIINQSAALHRWGGENPIGKRISFGPNPQGQITWIEIVGIVGDVKHYGLDRDPADEIYVPLAQQTFANFLLVRTASDPMSLATLMRDTVHKIDPETAVDRVETLDRVRSESVASPRLTAILLSMFAGLALLITAAGLAGVMALSVSQRTRELGIRMALGASQSSVLRLVMKQGMLLVIIGLVLGVAGALALTRLMATLLFSTEPTDPVTFLAVALVLLSVAAMACFMPARRVTAIDPMLALRSE
jgi:predicted permease